MHSAPRDPLDEANPPPLAVSVVIPTCDRPQLLMQCLDSVRVAVDRAGTDIEVIVTDDSGGDDTRRLVVADYPWVHWHRGPRKGPASNRNAGVRMSRGGWIFFVDDDCVVDPGWSAAFLAAITHRPESRVLEGRTVTDRRRERLDEESPVNEHGGYFWSCNIAITRALFDRLDGFCETFPHASMEDVDLRLRIQALGERFPFVADALVCHPLRNSKGLRFLIKQGRSYLHLVSRHPHLVSPTRWRKWLANSFRRTRSLLRDARLLHYRGLTHGTLELMVGIYFDFLAHCRYGATSREHRHP